jgi:hypothetical protein
MLPQYGGPSLTAVSDQSNKVSPLGTTSFATSKNKLTHARACQCVRELDQGIDRMSSLRENPYLLRVPGELTLTPSCKLKKAMTVGLPAVPQRRPAGKALREYLRL